MEPGGNLWDNKTVLDVAFHPQQCQPRTGGCWVDSQIAARDGVSLAYRLYTAPAPPPDQGGGRRPCVLVYFHANAEICTDLEPEITRFFGCGFRAVLCPEFRGYAWSAGKPKLTTLCPDAEDFARALPEILSGAGLDLRDPSVVVHGRSLGAICAIHLAAQETLASGVIGGLVVESGVISLLDLPLVKMMAQMMPQLLQALRAAPNPLNTQEELRRVVAPTLFIHGDHDEMSPIEQAKFAHKICGSSAKKLLRYARCGHNDIRSIVGKEYFAELETVCKIASDALPPEALLEARPSGSGFFGMLQGALRCFAGARQAPRSEDGAGT